MNKTTPDDWEETEKNELPPITPETRMQPPPDIKSDPDKLRLWLEWRDRFEREWEQHREQDKRSRW